MTNATLTKNATFRALTILVAAVALACPSVTFAAVPTDILEVLPEYWYSFEIGSITEACGSKYYTAPLSSSNKDYSFVDSGLRGRKAIKSTGGSPYAESGITYGSGAWSVFSRVKFTGSSKWYFAWSIGNAKANQGGALVCLTRNSAGQIAFSLTQTTTAKINFKNIVYATVDSPYTRFHSCGGTYDPDTKKFTVYVDGVSCGTLDFTQFQNQGGYQWFGQIGGSADAATATGTNTEIDDWRMYHRALSADDFQTLHEAAEMGERTLWPGYLGTTDRLIWPGVRLSNVTNIVALGGGSNLSTTGDRQMTSCHYQNDGTSASVQFQAKYDAYNRCVKVAFTQKSDGVWAKYEYARYVKNKEIGGFNYDTETGWTEQSRASNIGQSGFGVHMLRAQTASPYPVAVRGVTNLAGDAEWVEGVTNLVDGTVDLKGHKLTLKPLADSLQTPLATVTDSVGGGEFRVDVPANGTYRSVITMTGSAKFVKDGSGEFQQNSTSLQTTRAEVTGGTLSIGGTLVCGGLFDHGQGNAASGVARLNVRGGTMTAQCFSNNHGSAEVEIADGGNMTVSADYSLSNGPESTGLVIKDGTLEVNGTLTVGASQAINLMWQQGLAAPSLRAGNLVPGAAGGKIKINLTDSEGIVPERVYTVLTESSGVRTADDYQLTLNGTDASVLGTVTVSGGVLTLTLSEKYVAWTGAAGDGLFTTPGNWEGGKVPGVGERFYFPPSETLTSFNYDNRDPVSLGKVFWNGPYAITGQGGLSLASLDLGTSGRLVIDPVVTDLRIACAPSFAAGAKIALAPKYAAFTKGRFLLMTWDSGTLDTSSAAFAQLFDTTSAAGVSPALSVETIGGRGYLWLDLDSTATYPVLKVMPLGDSITEGKATVDNYGNWRITYMKAMAAAGYDVQSRGFRAINSEDQTGAPMPAKWCSHSGVSSYRVTTEQDGLAGHQDTIGALLDQAGDVDVVLMLLGTNDIEKGADAASILPNWSNLVAKIAAVRPTVRVVAGTVLDRKDANTAKREQVDALNAALKDLVASNAFRANQVFLADTHDVAPTNLFFNVLHPDFPGMVAIGQEFARVAQSALTAPAVEATAWTPTLTTGAAANVPAGYMTGYKLARTLRPAALSRYAAGSDPYEDATGNPGAVTDISRVGYYIELKRKNTDTCDYGGHVRWMWLDMDAWGDCTIGTVGLPLDVSNQLRVSRLHVASNEPLVETILPTDDTVTGWVQGTKSSISVNASSATGAPAHFFGWDWNDAFNASGTYGVWQVYRLTPGATREATTLFSFNRWARAADNTATEVLLSDFAQTISSRSMNGIYTFGLDTMNLSAYESMTVEIYTLSEADDPARKGADAVVDAVAIVGTTATVTGELTSFGPLGTSATVTLEWSEDPTFATVTGTAAIGEKTELGALTGTAKELVDGKTYYFRFTAVNNRSATSASPVSRPYELATALWRASDAGSAWGDSVWLKAGTDMLTAFTPAWNARFDGAETCADGTVELLEDVLVNSIVVDAAKDYTLTGTGRLTGGGPIVKSGTGTFTIDGAGLGDARDVIVSNGVLRIGENATGSVLGASRRLEVAEGATFAKCDGAKLSSTGGIDNEGIVTVAAGTLDVGAPVTGDGTYAVAGGTLLWRKGAENPALDLAFALSGGAVQFGDYAATEEADTPLFKSLAVDTTGGVVRFIPTRDCSVTNMSVKGTGETTLALKSSKDCSLEFVAAEARFANVSCGESGRPVHAVFCGSRLVVDALFDLPSRCSASFNGESELRVKEFKRSSVSDVTRFHMDGGVLAANPTLLAPHGFPLVFGSRPEDAVTLDTGSENARLRTGLTGPAAVTVTGTGLRVDDSGKNVAPQGVPTGKWTVNTTGKAYLKGASAFGGGLELADNVQAALYVSGSNTCALAITSCTLADATSQVTATRDSPAEPLFTVNNFNLLHAKFAATDPYAWGNHVYDYTGEFYVDEADLGDDGLRRWSFAGTYDDRIRLEIDGNEVLLTTTAGEIKQGVVTGMTAGWHSFRIIAVDGGGAYGPRASGWDNVCALGWTNGYTTATAKTAYRPFTADSFRAMRPKAGTASRIDWQREAVTSDIYTAGDAWKTASNWTSNGVVSALSMLSRNDWAPASKSLNRFTGWVYVRPEDAGVWEVSASFDNVVDLWLDGKDAGVNGRLVAEGGTQFGTLGEVSAGWHRFEVRTYDRGGGWGPWPTDTATIRKCLAVRSTNAAGAVSAWRAFDETNFMLTRNLDRCGQLLPAGLHGTTTLRGGAKLINEGTGCPIWGTLAGVGTLSGPFAFAGEAGRWAMTGVSANRQLAAVTFEGGISAAAIAGLRNISVDFDAKPSRQLYYIGELATNAELPTAEELAKIGVSISVAGTPLTPAKQFTLGIVNGKLALRNPNPAGVVITLR